MTKLKPKVGEIWEIGNREGNALVLVKDDKIIPTIFGPSRRIYVLDFMSAEKLDINDENLCTARNFIRRIQEAA